MPLNPTRGRFGLAGAARPSLDDLADAAARKTRADAHPSVVAFREQREKVLAEIKAGRTTPSVGRERLAELAGRYRAEMEGERRNPPADHPLFARLRGVAEDRRQKEMTGDIATALRELVKTNRALLVEQQLQSRRDEFLGRVTPAAIPGGLDGKGGPRRPTADTLIGFLDYAERADDPAAAEFARRELGALRLTADPATTARIDEATARPELVTPGQVDSVLADLEKIASDAFGWGDATCAQVVAKVAEDAVKSGDASVIAGLYVAARQYPADRLPGWYPAVSRALEAAPADALRALRAWEASTAAAAEQEARALLDDAVAAMADEGQLRGVEAPTAEQLRQRAEGERRTEAIRQGKPIGLARTAPSDPADATAVVAALTT